MQPFKPGHVQVDLTPPVCSPPVDFLSGDQAPRFTARRAGVGAEWECSDPESGIPLTFWRPQGNGVALSSKDRWYVGTSETTVRQKAAAATPMVHAMTYSSCVSAVNGAGEVAVNYTCSPGFTFDRTQPLAGAVRDIGGARFTTDATEICTEWSEFGEDVSGIERLTWELVEV